MLTGNASIRLKACMTTAILIFAALCSESPQAQTHDREALARTVARMLQTIGLNYEVEVEEKVHPNAIPLGLPVKSFETFFNILLPARGLSYDMISDKRMVLQTRERFWDGPEKLNHEIPPRPDGIVREVTVEGMTPNQLAFLIERTFEIPVILDHRIEPYRQLGFTIQARSLEELLQKIEQEADWEWTIADGILFFIPGPQDRVLKMSNDRTWVFADATLLEICSALENRFDVEFEVYGELRDRPITANLRGLTLGDVLEQLCQAAPCSFKIESGKVLLTHAGESPASNISSGKVGRRITLTVEIFAIDKKVWEGNEMSRFLTRMPPPEAGEQKEKLDKLRASKGVRLFGSAVETVVSGESVNLRFPFKSEEDNTRAGYRLTLSPIAVDSEIVEIALRMQFKDLPAQKDPVDPLGFYEIPLAVNLVSPDGSWNLLQGAVTGTKKDPIHLLIALRPNIVD